MNLLDDAVRAGLRNVPKPLRLPVKPFNGPPERMTASVKCSLAFGPKISCALWRRSIVFAQPQDCIRSRV